MSVVPFPKEARYNSIQNILKDVSENFSEATEGILVLFHDGKMYEMHVCLSHQLAHAAAYLLHSSVNDDDD